MTDRSRHWYSETFRSALIAIVVCLGGALVLGGLTSFGQQYLPPWINSFANSAGGWAMLTFLLVWLGRARPLLAGILGVVAFEALNEGYGLVSGWRGSFYSAPFSSIWTLAGLAAGPVLGVAASLTRYGTSTWRLMGVTPLSAVLLGDGVWGLLRVSDTTSPVYWSLEIALSVLFMVLAIARSRPPTRARLLALAVWLVGSVAYFVAFDTLLS